MLFGKSSTGVTSYLEPFSKKSIANIGLVDISRLLIKLNKPAKGFLLNLWS